VKTNPLSPRERVRVRVDGWDRFCASEAVPHTLTLPSPGGRERVLEGRLSRRERVLEGHLFRPERVTISS
jgi:hypothetical protein